MTNLESAVVLVVGATGGLGSRIATQLESAGATVIRSGRTSGGVVADLRDAGSAASLVADAVSRHGRLDGVVIAAGVVAFGPIAELTDETVGELFAVNAIAPIALIREAAPHLGQAGGGFIVTISGVVAEFPTAGMAAYSASKAATNAFVAAAAREVRRQGIRVLDARPGHTETALSHHPIAGAAPSFAAGLDPDAVAARIIRAIIDDEKDLPSSAFSL